jgi:hypothetical protein
VKFQLNGLAMVLYRVSNAARRWRVRTIRYGLITGI